MADDLGANGKEPGHARRRGDCESGTIRQTRRRQTKQSDRLEVWQRKTGFLLGGLRLGSRREDYFRRSLEKICRCLRQGSAFTDRNQRLNSVNLWLTLSANVLLCSSGSGYRRAREPT